MTNALSTFRHLWRRPMSGQWARLERDLGHDDQSIAESAELRHYLAAQTSQVV